MIPYSAEVLLSFIGRYNAAIWPLQPVALLLAAASLYFTMRPVPGTDRAIAALLALAWLFVGAVYHYTYLAGIDFWAPAIGAVFVLQAVLLAWSGLLRGKVTFRFTGGRREWAGVGVAIFALSGYPLLALALGREVDAIGTFAALPAPTVMFTLGALLLAQPRPPIHLVIIPLLWCAIGGAVAYGLGIGENLTLPMVGAIAIAASVTAIATGSSRARQERK